MMRDTSLLCFMQLKQEGELGKRQSQIYKLLQNNDSGLTDSEIMRCLGYNIPNSVRPRRKELYNAGLIIANGKRKCSITGRTCYTWRAKKNGK